jgi:O-antigen/teichoic acid export membrane protein
MSFIGSNMGRVFFQQISCSRETLASTSLQVLKISFLLGLSVILFFIVGGDYLLYWVLGPEWKMAGEYALYLSLWSFVTISFAPIKPIYRVLSKQSLQMRLMIVSFVIQTLFLLLAANTMSNIGHVIFFYSIICSVFKVVEGFCLLKLCNNTKFLCNKLVIISSILIIVGWTLRSIIRLEIL